MRVNGLPRIVALVNESSRLQLGCQLIIVVSHSFEVLGLRGTRKNLGGLEFIKAVLGKLLVRDEEEGGRGMSARQSASCGTQGQIQELWFSLPVSGGCFPSSSCSGGASEAVCCHASLMRTWGQEC